MYTCSGWEVPDAYCWMKQAPDSQSAYCLHFSVFYHFRLWNRGWLSSRHVWKEISTLIMTWEYFCVKRDKVITISMTESLSLIIKGAFWWPALAETSFSSRFCFEHQTKVTSAADSCMLGCWVPPFRSVQITLYNSYTVWPAHPVQLNYKWTFPTLHHEKVKCSYFTALSHGYVSFLSYWGGSRSTVNTGHNLKYARSDSSWESAWDFIHFTCWLCGSRNSRVRQLLYHVP